jgi:hypothetical protein
MRGYGDGGSRGGHGGGRGKIPCQVCGKIGHSALRCYKRFDANYNGEEKYANATTTRYNVDTEWYMDTGATVHITSELDKLKKVRSMVVVIKCTQLATQVCPFVTLVNPLLALVVVILFSKIFYMYPLSQRI